MAAPAGRPGWGAAGARQVSKLVDVQPLDDAARGRPAWAPARAEREVVQRRVEAAGDNVDVRSGPCVARMHSNAVDVLFDRGRFVIADAGGNAIDRASFFGRVSNLAVFPNRLVPNPFGGPDIPMQAVPTSVVEGPDHQYYVTQLTGFPFPPGGANVYRVDPRSATRPCSRAASRTSWTSRSAATGRCTCSRSPTAVCSAAPTARSSPSSAPGPSARSSCPPGTLTAPGGITVGRDGLYVSNQTFVPGQGQVLRIQPR